MDYHKLPRNFATKLKPKAPKAPPPRLSKEPQSGKLSKGKVLQGSVAYEKGDLLVESRRIVRHLRAKTLSLVKGSARDAELRNACCI